MMKYRQLLRACVPCLLLAVAPLLSHCGEAAGFGTETGNPPQIEGKKLRLEVAAGGVRVVGEPGAVAPPGAPVRVTNVTTGVSVETTAAADGSLDVVIAGDLDDEFEVTVTSAGRETNERVSLRPMASGADLGGTACATLEDTLSQTLAEVFAAADAACTNNGDCTSLSHSSATDCYDQCGEGYLSRAGATAAAAEGQARTAAVCAALSGCERPPSPVCSGGGQAECIAGRCGLSCVDSVRAAGVRRSELRDRANQQCLADSDCALADVFATCLVECPAALESVARAAVAGLETTVRDEVETAYCTPFFARGCTVPNLACSKPPGVPAAFCDAGTCGVRYAE